MISRDYKRCKSGMEDDTVSGINPQEDGPDRRVSIFQVHNLTNERKRSCPASIANQNWKKEKTIKIFKTGMSSFQSQLLEYAIHAHPACANTQSNG